VLNAPIITGSNPFIGLFDWLGQTTDTFPYYHTGYPNGMSGSQIAQIVAGVLIAFFLGLGSFRNAGASCLIAWAFGGIMFAIGWWNGGVATSSVSALPLWGLAGFLSVMIMIQEKKEQGGGLS
jgi:hypothetical protein